MYTYSIENYVEKNGIKIGCNLAVKNRVQGGQFLGYGKHKNAWYLYCTLIREHY